MRNNLRLTLISLSVSLALAACGGGGGGSDTTAAVGAQTGTQNNDTTTPSSNNPGPGPQNGNQPAPLPAEVAATASMTMTCFDTPDAGLAAQCSGDSIIRTDNGVALTSSGVQVYGASTSDLATKIEHPEKATGFKLASGGIAEVRLFKDSKDVVSKPTLLLTNLGIKWDGKNESPPIIETFQPTQGRVKLVDNKIAVDAFHDHADTAFYNFVTLGTSAKQANYANNRYFPRADPARCSPSPCTTEVETTGITFKADDWTTGGTLPSETSGTRQHEDGDVHAGDGVSGSTGPGVPFPGSKGYRDFYNASYKYANMIKWVSQDTAEIAEWAGTSNEHNLNRRGIVAFGAVTDPATIPTTGSVTYAGWMRGWYAPNSSSDPTSFVAEISVTVNFATRQVTISVPSAKPDDGSATAVPVAFTANVGMGAASSKVANYLNGALVNGSLNPNLKGGVGGRFFGPVANGAPPELGASLSLSDPATGASVIGGLIAIKR